VAQVSRFSDSSIIVWRKGHSFFLFFIFSLFFFPAALIRRVSRRGSTPLVEDGESAAAGEGE
jgi:hypothetical protein